jgi:PKD repeat protein
MRSIPLKAAGIFMLVAAWACGGDGGVGPNLSANFTQTCTGLNCTFNDASTPTGQITTWDWSFGDPNSGAANTSRDQNPTHTFSAAGTYNVQLTVTGSGNATNSKTTAVTVTAPANQPPVASFVLPTSCTAGTPCGFHSTSTDPDGNIALATFDWDFGDQGTGDTPDATHTYNAAGTYTVTLTVTDEDGAASAPATQQLTVSPAASQCTSAATTADCMLDITEKATVTVTLTSNQCELGGSRFDIISPIRQTVFFNGCLNSLEGTVFTLNGPNPDKSFNAGTTIQTRFTQGAADPEDPRPGPPEIRIDGAFPEWTLRIDDGGAPDLPRNDDIVLTVTATRVQ